MSSSEQVVWFLHWKHVIPKQIKFVHIKPTKWSHLACYFCRFRINVFPKAVLAIYCRPVLAIAIVVILQFLRSALCSVKMIILGKRQIRNACGKFIRIILAPLHKKSLCDGFSSEVWSFLNRT